MRATTASFPTFRWSVVTGSVSGLAPLHAAVDPQFVDHGPSPRSAWTDISRSLSALIGAGSDQRGFDGDVPVRCSRIGTHLVARLDEVLRRRALHPGQAHVEASRQAEGA